MLTRNINNNNYSNIPLPLVKFRAHKDQINKEKIKIQKINEFNNLKETTKFYLINLFKRNI